MKKIHSKVRRHALGRLSKSNISKTPKNLIEKLTDEILRGKLRRVELTPEGNKKGFIYYKKNNYFCSL